MQSIMVAHTDLFVIVRWKRSLGRLASTFHLCRLNLVVLFTSSHQVSVVLVTLAQMVFLHHLSRKRSLLVGDPLSKGLICSFLGHIACLEPSFLFFLLGFFADELNLQIDFTKIVQSFTESFLIPIDTNFPCLLMFLNIFSNFLDTIFINLRIMFIEINKPSQAILPFENIDLLMYNFYLLRDKLTNVHCFLLVIYIQLLILSYSLIEQFLLIGFKQDIYLLEDLLFVFLQLIVNALPEAHYIVIDLIVCFVELLEHYDVLITSLFCLSQGFGQIYVAGFIGLQEVLFGMLNNAVGAQWHQALGVAAKVCQEFVGVVCAEDLLYFRRVEQRRVIVLHSRHNRQQYQLYNSNNNNHSYNKSNMDMLTERHNVKHQPNYQQFFQLC